MEKIQKKDKEVMESKENKIEILDDLPHGDSKNIWLSGGNRT